MSGSFIDHEYNRFQEFCKNEKVDKNGKIHLKPNNITKEDLINMCPAESVEGLARAVEPSPVDFSSGDGVTLEFPKRKRKVVQMKQVQPKKIVEFQNQDEDREFDAMIAQARRSMHVDSPAAAQVPQVTKKKGLFG